MISVQVIGADATVARINDLANPEHRKRMLRIAGEAIRSRHIKLMTAGLDPNGVPLPPVQRWTRWVSGYNEKSKTLHRTGTLRRQMGVLMTTADMVKVGFTGSGAQVAQSMTYGLPGRIKVAARVIARLHKDAARNAVFSKKIKRAGRKVRSFGGVNKNGRPYFRIKTRFGWRTKVISSGHVSVNPQPRRFFYLGRGDIADITKAANAYYAKITRK